MSNSIWKTPKESPRQEQLVAWVDRKSLHAGRFDTCYNCFCTCASYFVDLRKVKKWCSLENLDDLIAQADKAERLEEENEAMREEFEVWHENYKCEVEDKERLQKALDLAVGALKKINETYEEEYYKGDDEHDSCDWLNCADDMDDLATATIDEIKQLIKGE